MIGMVVWTVFILDLGALRKTEMLQEIIKTTGAVVMGRRAYEMAEGDFTNYEFQVPIFVRILSKKLAPNQELSCS